MDQGEAAADRSEAGLAHHRESWPSSGGPVIRGDPLLTSEEQSRLRSLIKDAKDCQTLRKSGGSTQGADGMGDKDSKVANCQEAGVRARLGQGSGWYPARPS